jgi:hypothetical protein
MSAQQRRIHEITTFLEVNRKHLPGVVATYLDELLYMDQTSRTVIQRQQTEISDLRALLYGNPDARHERIQSGEFVRPPQVFRQGGWEDA